MTHPPPISGAPPESPPESPPDTPTRVRRRPIGGLGAIAGALALLWAALAVPAAAAGGATIRHAATAPDPAALCEEATRRASAEAGVPVAILQAIALAETGRRDGGRARPWPWALNFGGPGAWFEDRGAALAALRAALGQGRRNIDIGCFQINHRWHAEGFASLEEMIDPLANARYAARFLRSLHAETGSWIAAAGAYHSRTPVHAARYRTAVARHLEAMGEPAPREAPLPLATRAATAPPAPDPGESGARPPAPRMPGSIFDGRGLLVAPLGALAARGG
jgi:hypothetical protein